MTLDEARKVARDIEKRVFASSSHERSVEIIAAALLAASAQQREEDARIADNLAKWADAKEPRDDAEYVICTRIAAAIRGKP